MYVSYFIEIGKTILWMDYPQGHIQVQGQVTQKLTQLECGPMSNVMAAID